jgi:hypothetical protein
VAHPAKLKTMPAIAKIRFIGFPHIASSKIHPSRTRATCCLPGNRSRSCAGCIGTPLSLASLTSPAPVQCVGFEPATVSGDFPATCRAIPTRLPQVSAGIARAGNVRASRPRRHRFGHRFELHPFRKRAGSMPCARYWIVPASTKKAKPPIGRLSRFRGAGWERAPSSTRSARRPIFNSQSGLAVNGELDGWPRAGKRRPLPGDSVGPVPALLVKGGMRCEKINRFRIAAARRPE